MPKWGFGVDHKRVLIHVFQHPRTTLREISEALGIAERRTLSIARQLEEVGCLERRWENRRTRYRFNLRWLFDDPAEGSNDA